MLLYLVETLNRLRRDDLSFFQEAYIWAFKKEGEVSNDVVQYRLHAIIPKYVQKYLQHIKESTT